ncbi:MAG: ribbon-helix-helix protein, CopG family [Betaproteobacteria bacterium]|nr:ribbon-helix-helix protein, CopG family [Betaproteobacteria bacterium]
MYLKCNTILFMAISLRVPEDVKTRIAKLAKAREVTPHAFMLEAIREKIEDEEARAVFQAEAARRLAKMKKAGVGIPAKEVFEYFSRLAKGETPVRPKPRKLP